MWLWTRNMGIRPLKDGKDRERRKGRLIDIQIDAYVVREIETDSTDKRQKQKLEELPLFALSSRQLSRGR